MRAVSATVVKGKVVTRAKLPEGARLTVVVHDVDELIELDAEDEAEISGGIAEVKSGQFVGARSRSGSPRRR
jgi:hypothetical protein